MDKPVRKPMRCKAYNLVIELELQAVSILCYEKYTIWHIDIILGDLSGSVVM